MIMARTTHRGPWSWRRVTTLAGAGLFLISPYTPPAIAQELLHAFVGDSSQWDQGFYRFDSTGDVDGDGIKDLIYGCPLPHMHRVRSGADWSTLVRYQSSYRPGWHDSHGSDVAGIGLWDDDNVPDYAVGSPGAFTLEFYEGVVRVFSGATHTLIQEIDGPGPWEKMGNRVYGLGDLDGDGHPEMATTGLSKTWVRIYSAPDGILLREHDTLSIGTGRNPEVVRYGDWDGDGGEDYLIGEYFYSGSYPVGGRVILFSGKTGAELMSMVGRRESEKVGLTVSVAGDWNGDGIDDIAAGAPGSWSAAGGDECGAYVFSGADGSILRFFDGADYAAPNAAFGDGTVSGQDVNGDGFPDLLVGAPAEDAHPPHWRSGAVYLISGHTGAVLWKHVGRPDNDYKLGQYLYLIDDHDDDGLAEWVVSDPLFIPPGETYKTGRIAIYRGAVGDASGGCPSTPNSAGPGAHLTVSGPISLRNNLTELVVEGTPPAAPAQLVYGTPGPPVPFGDGTLCVSGELHHAASLVTDGGGAAVIPIDLQSAAFSSGPGAIHVGDTVAFQLLYTDPAAGGRNASDSVIIRFLP